MRNLIHTALPSAFIALIMTGCAPLVPKELADARLAYQHASQSAAAQVVPAELHKARESLDKAEQSFGNEPEAQITRDLSYVAQRKSQLAEALAAQSLDHSQRKQAEHQYQEGQVEIQKQTVGQLNQTREQLAASQQQNKSSQAQLTQEQLARQNAERNAADAEARARQMQDALAKLAAVKEEQRGLVITLSGSVLFASDQAVLLPEAQNRLGQVAAALLATKERNIVIEGHTDSRGSDSHNVDLSQRRAEAVRSYLISKGYEPDRIQAHGMGKATPIADNNSAEGRANNRRVEIVIQPNSNKIGSL